MFPENIAQSINKNNYNIFNIKQNLLHAAGEKCMVLISKRDMGVGV